jgi:lysyl-tRNA synthetase class 2
MTHLIQPSIPDDRIQLVYDYPRARRRSPAYAQGDVPVAERFELYLGPLELANGYQRTQRHDRTARAIPARP